MKNFYRKSFFTFSAFFILAAGGLAQTNKKALTISLGLSDEGYGYPNHLSETQTNICPTVNIYSDYSLSKTFSVGLYGGYTYSYYKFDSYAYPSENYKDAWKGWDVGLRYTAHLSGLFTKNKKIDFYVSAFSGYTTRALAYDKKNIYRDSLNFHTRAFSAGAILGARYYISNRIGFYGEMGLSRNFFAGGGITYQITCRRK